MAILRILAFLTILLFVVAVLQPKYIPDGEVFFFSNFEESSQSFSSWTSSEAGVSRVSGGGYKGSTGAMLVAGEGTSPYLERVLSEPRRFSLLELKGKLRTENVVPREKSNRTARMLLFFRDKDGKSNWNYPHTAATLRGSSEWQEYERVFPVPDYAASAHIVVSQQGQSGLVVSDDIQLRPVRINSRFVFLRSVFFALGGLLLAASAITFQLWKGKKVYSVLLIAAILMGVLISGQWLEAAASAIHVPLWIMKKGGHFLLFAGLSCIFRRWLPYETINALQLIFSLLVFAAVTELLQMLTFDRSPALIDWMTDAAGILCGYAIARWSLTVVKAGRVQPPPLLPREKYRQNETDPSV